MTTKSFVEPLVLDGRYPMPQELGGMVVDVADDDAWEASMGNDGAQLRANWMRFDASEDGVIHVHWRARWQWDETDDVVRG
jgi:hypothetical protein